MTKGKHLIPAEPLLPEEMNGEESVTFPYTALSWKTTGPAQASFTPPFCYFPQTNSDTMYGQANSAYGAVSCSFCIKCRFLQDLLDISASA